MAFRRPLAQLAASCARASRAKTHSPRTAHHALARTSQARNPVSTYVARRYASSVGNPSAVDPIDIEANNVMVKGIHAMGQADLEGAKEAFERSIQIKETAAAQYNLALALYQLGRLPDCITAFERSIELSPSSDAHTNVASAYILSTPPNASKAIEHLQRALALSPDDGEIHFNMGVIFEASDRLEDALREYNRSSELGIERAAQCIRNVGGKILSKKRAQMESSSEEQANP